MTESNRRTAGEEALFRAAEQLMNASTLTIDEAKRTMKRIAAFEPGGAVEQMRDALRVLIDKHQRCSRFDRLPLDSETKNAIAALAALKEAERG